VVLSLEAMNPRAELQRHVRQGLTGDSRTTKEAFEWKKLSYSLLNANPSTLTYASRHQEAARRLFVWIERLPEFDFVAVGIVYPGEAAVAFVLALRVDANAFFRQALEQCFEIVDDVVHHERG